MAMDFDARPVCINAHTILRLPPEISQALPSRGMVMAEVSVNGAPHTLPLEPDGRGSHWFEMEGVPSETVHVSLKLLKDWPEPELPGYMMHAILDAGLLEAWRGLTTKARWEWLRFIRAAQSPITRQKRLEVTLSKLQSGAKRPCCFDATRSSIPEVSKAGRLLEVR